VKITTFKYFYPERPVLIRIDQPLFETLSESPEWVAERKYNGCRLQLHYFEGEFQFWNRHGEKFSYEPSPELRSNLEALDLKSYCLFDGELRHHKTAGISHRIMLYDVFIWQGELLITQPFWFRRNILKQILTCDAEPLGTPFQFKKDFRSAFDEVTVQAEIEGLVMKNMKGTLSPGRSRASESRWMFKVRKPSNSYRF
jgi:ATP-dependent DNA ligase